MNQPSRTLTSTSEDLPADLVELVAKVAELPENLRPSIQQALTRVIDSTKRRRRILTLVQDALGQLRLDMKYLMFDLESTRRERDDYRRKVEEI